MTKSCDRLKECNECGESKPLSAFPKDKRHIDLRAGKCKECTNKKAMLRYYNNPAGREKQYGTQRKRILERKTKAVEYLGGKCNDCGVVGHPCIYDFHHLDPAEKEKKPADLKSCSWETMKKELDKCVLLCSNCHRIRHYSV